MNLTQEQLFKNVFKLHTVSSENKLFLKNTVNTYPYFGLAHFYALKNSAFHDVHYNKLAAKTYLFFNSPFYLEKIICIDDQLELTNITKNNIAQPNENNILTVNDEQPKILSESNTNTFETNTNEVNENNLRPLPIFTKQEMSVNNNDIISPKNEIDEINDTDGAEINLPPLPIFSKQEMAVNNKEELLFEPLYTSDYFASQGIKLSDIISSNDKLGLQLKSFTSWLKTMKKTHPEKQLLTNEIAEAQVQKQAENSNIETEVFTEPMAEAFAAQGKNIRAIEIYTKLSLMFPEKSTYFAHKIENLK
jgi:hypothetical protein